MTTDLVSDRAGTGEVGQLLAEIFSAYDLIIVFAVLLLVFGGTQLPKLARSLGSAQSEFKKGLSEGDDAQSSESESSIKTSS
jgi:sec-independent protein translocase protein TatA